MCPRMYIIVLKQNEQAVWNGNEAGCCPTSSLSAGIANALKNVMKGSLPKRLESLSGMKKPTGMGLNMKLMQAKLRKAEN